MTYASIADNGCDCSGLNDTFIVDWVGVIGASCRYYYELPSPICGVGGVEMRIEPFGLDYAVRALLVESFNGIVLLSFAKTYVAAKPQCSTLNGEALTYILQDPFWTCDGSGASCSVTAV